MEIELQQPARGSRCPLCRCQRIAGRCQCANGEPMQACADSGSDCLGYAAVDRLTRMNDGREVCPPCATRARELSFAKSQQALFDNQTSIFDLGA